EPAAEPQVAAAVASDASAPLEIPELPETSPAEALLADAAAVAATASDGAAPDDGDDVMKQFAAAVEVQKAPPPMADGKMEAPPAEAAPPAPVEDDPLAGALDPDKIMNEVQSLDSNAASGDALEESLDTDKLLAEVGSMSPGPAPTPAPAAEKVIPAFDPK